MVKLFVLKGRTIFPTGLGPGIGKLFSFLDGKKYNNKGLQSVLDEYL